MRNREAEFRGRIRSVDKDQSFAAARNQASAQLAITAAESYRSSALSEPVLNVRDLQERKFDYGKWEREGQIPLQASWKRFHFSAQSPKCVDYTLLGRIEPHAISFL